MDSYSYLRKDEALQFDHKAGIRSATRKVYTWDDDYGCTYEDFGFDYWYYQMKLIYRVRNRKHVSKTIEHVTTARKKYRRQLQDIFDTPDDDD